jgi:hypothetical protein
VARRRSANVLVKVIVHAEETIENLQDMQDRANDMRPVFAWGKRELERAYSNNFTSMGSESARAMLKGAWPPLDPQYASWKLRNQPTPMMIGPTARLFRSVADLAQSPANSTTNSEATFFVDNPIAKFHQYGTENMPARRLVFTPRDFEDDFAKKVAKYVKNGANGL